MTTKIIPASSPPAPVGLGVEHYQWLNAHQMIDGLALGETTPGNPKFTAPLTAITVVVVGVILNLAVFFVWYTLWPVATYTATFPGQFEWFSMLIWGTTFIAIWRYKVSVMEVIGTYALLGL